MSKLSIVNGYFLMEECSTASQPFISRIFFFVFFAMMTHNIADAKWIRTRRRKRRGLLRECDTIVHFHTKETRILAANVIIIINRIC